MTQATDTGIRELRDLIVGMNTEVRGLKDLISDVDKKIDDVKADIRVMDTRLIEVEKKIEKLDTKIDKQDNRLWAFVGVMLTIALGALSTIGVRYIFINKFWEYKLLL